MTRCIPVGSIYRPSKSGSGGTKGPEFIRCVEGQDPQMHEIWCFGSDGITREFHPTAQLYFGDGVVGQLWSDYLAENRRRIPILIQISINGIVEILGIPDFHRTSGPMYTDNIMAPHDTTGWGYGGTPN